MAKKSKKVKRDNGSRRVTAFFFHGDVSRLGDELAKALKKAGFADLYKKLATAPDTRKLYIS